MIRRSSGFTLIELLLVLAIIGIICAIAIPALLGQRARSRDKVCQSNAISILSDLISATDRHRETVEHVPALAEVNTAIIGTGVASSKVPMVWTAINPWTAISLGFKVPVVMEASEDGANTSSLATPLSKGQVQLGWMAPATEKPGMAVSAVYLHNTFKSENNTDTHIFLRRAYMD